MPQTTDSAMPSAAGEHVAILLSTFNGAGHLASQLDSIHAQDHRDWTVYASDDGSTDATLEILRDYRERWGDGRLVIMHGPRAGYAANFMSLIGSAQVAGDCFAFCDQDDRWAADKLSRALAWMRRQPAQLPALYCGRTCLIDVDDRPIGCSPLFRRRPSFRNALVQSLAGGNTMLLNAPCRRLMARAGGPITSHDWWAYLVATGCGGAVHYDPLPAIGYRQHADNLIGSNASVKARLQRLQKMLQGSYAAWNAINLAALAGIDDQLTAENRRLAQLLHEARRSRLPRRLQRLARARLYRQTLAGNLGLALAALLGRI